MRYEAYSYRYIPGIFKKKKKKNSFIHVKLSTRYIIPIVVVYLIGITYSRLLCIVYTMYIIHCIIYIVLQSLLQ